MWLKCGFSSAATSTFYIFKIRRCTDPACLLLGPFAPRSESANRSWPFHSLVLKLYLPRAKWLGNFSTSAWAQSSSAISITENLSAELWRNSPLGEKEPGSESSRERNGQGANWPGSYWPIRSRERIGPRSEKARYHHLVRWIVVCLKHVGTETYTESYTNPPATHWCMAHGSVVGVMTLSA